MNDPISYFIRQQGFFVLDGGMATQLEARGADLNDRLWSAKVLLEDTDLIRRVHLDFLRAGADCIVSATYQATFHELLRRGMTRADASELLHLSVWLALETRNAFWSHPANRAGRIEPIVGASVGPYGAYLADGSEYSGDYDMDEQALYEFHRERWRTLAETAAEIIACETIPSGAEARALTRLLDETPDKCMWISFNCSDGETIADGSSLRDTVAELDNNDRIAAFGVNCTPPSLVSDLIPELRQVSDKPIMVYPNSGEGWDAERKQWTGVAEPVHFGEKATEWFNLGATCVGGCCRTGPGHIREIRAALVSATMDGRRNA
ncbi:MAG: homocysteine S-methyltransferase [Gemmatimonadota bacterium]|nr:MAG: homocysteine S-methyltransferase [Gemmatimonadota bacterium]